MKLSSQQLKSQRLLISLKLNFYIIMTSETPKPEQVNDAELVTKVENAYEINRKMEIQAELLGINLEKLKAEIDKAGGPEKFRELADKGFYKGASNPTEGEQAFRRMRDRLQELRDLSSQKVLGGTSAALGAFEIIALQFDKGDSPDGAYTLLAGLLVLFAAGTAGSLISSIVKKVKANGQYIKTKMVEMKLDMTGSVRRENLAGDPKEKKIRQKTDKILVNEIIVEKKNKKESIDDIL